MTNDLDVLLGRLRDEPLHPGLEGLEENVFSRLASIQQFSREALRRAGIFSVAGAALLGIASNTIVPQEATPSPWTSFATASPLAPSALLLGVR